MFALLLASPGSWAQVTTAGTITGTVVDASGAVVPQATVTITNQSTNAQSKTSTNADGGFVVAGLTPGTYGLKVGKEGFVTFAESGIVLHPTQVITVNPTMKVGQVTTEVSVVASAVQVQTATPELSNQVSQQQVENLPLNGRNYQSLSALMPGVTNLNPDTALNQGGFLTSNAMSINGMGQSGTMYYLDGIWNMNTGNMTQTTITPNPDTVQEVRVLQNNYGAEYSLMGANVVVLQTKSGTDHFHGSLFEYLRNNAFDARNFFAPTVPALKQNIFGGTLGGPLYLPKHKPSELNTFFFGSVQWSRQVLASVVNGATPTTAMRNGTFDHLITDPQTGQPFPQVAPGEYQIPQTMINPQAVLLMNTMAQLPNNGTGFLNYLNLTPQHNNTRDDQGKIDHNFGPRLRVMAEYLDDRQLNGNTHDTFFSSPFTTNSDPVKTNNQLAQVRLTSILSPTMVNSTSVSMNNYVVNLSLAGIWTVEQIPGFTENLPFKGGFNSNRLPDIEFSGGWASFGDDTSLPLNHASDLEDTVADDWSWLRGNHYIQAGGQVVLGTKRQTLFAADNGQWTFTGSFTGDPIADYLLGDASTFYQQSTEPRPYVHYVIASPYVQDRWKATRRLTVTAGLRVEYLPEPSPATGYDSAFNPALYNPKAVPIVNPDGTITPTASYNPLNGVVLNGVGGVPQNFSTAHQWYWAPTAGFAYDLFGDGKTALRGGYGITYDRTPTGTDCSYQCATNIPRVQSITLQSAIFPNPIGASSPPPGAPTFGQNTAFDTLRAASIQTYSLSLEHQFARNWFASIAGAGNVAHHVGDFWNINQPLTDAPFDFNPLINSDPALPGKVGIFPYVYAPYQGYAGMSTFVSNDSAYWNALEILVRHPVGNNLFLNFAYTWQHDLSEDLNTALFENANTMQNVYAPTQNYGNSPLNVPQIFTFSYIWNLPWFQGGSGWQRQVLGGWKYAGLTTIQSGFSMNPGLSVSNQGLATRANRVAGSSVTGPKTAEKWFNTAAFTAPAYGFFGSGAPGSIAGPGVVNFDMSLYKDFRITEGSTVEFRAEGFNIFNHTDFSGVSTSVGAGNYGQVTSALDPRIFEFALRFQF